MRLFCGATILTMDDVRPRAEALPIERHRITAFADEAAVDATAPAAARIDRAGGCLLPGFIDTRPHFSEDAHDR